MSRRGLISISILALVIAALAYGHHALRTYAASQVEPAATAPAPGTSPLDRVLTPAQLKAFERGEAALALTDYADELSDARGVAIIRAGCSKLTGDQLLVAALETDCRATLALARMHPATGTDCSAKASDARCGHRMLRWSAVLRDAALATRGLARAVRRTVPAGPCRAALAPAHVRVSAELRHAAATRRYADAILDADSYQEDIDAAFAKVKAASKVIDHEDFYPRARAAARACNLPAWAFQW